MGVIEGLCFVVPYHESVSSEELYQACSTAAVPSGSDLPTLTRPCQLERCLSQRTFLLGQPLNPKP